MRVTITQATAPASRTVPTAAAPPHTLTLKVDAPADPTSVRIAEPVRVGVPLPIGLCSDERLISVAGPGGAILTQAAALERWPDGSIRWALLDFRANAPSEYVVRFAQPGPAPELPAIADDAGATEIRLEGRVFRIARAGEFRVDVTSPDAAARSLTMDVSRADGTLVHPDVAALAWETIGPVRSVLRVDGSIAAGTGKTLQLTVRLHFHAGSPVVRLEVALLNPARAEHPDGFWELGDPGSVLIRDCSMAIATGPADDLRCSVEESAPLAPVAAPVELYQDSSGGENWQSRAHLNRDGIVPLSFRGYRFTAGSGAAAGDRAVPVLWVGAGPAATGVAVRHFWQNAPKSLEFDAGRLLVRLFPRQFADLHEIQAGERKTHVVHVAFGEDRTSALPLDWVRRPVLASAAPAWYCAAGAVPYLTPMADDPHTDYVQLVESVIEGPESFERRREQIDEYGWRNFGDIYADHESAYYSGPLPIVSHYNNQYDAIGGFATQFFRTSDPRWWAAMDELAAHVRDIDIYHTAGDKAAYNGGLFWHTAHYVDAGRSSHRCYPKAPGSPGGGPSNEQAYSTGLMLHYLLTGEPASRDAAIELAEWVLRMDEGRSTPFGRIWAGPTGLSSKTHTLEYHGPGRGAGNAMVVLLNGYRLSGRAEFLAKVEALIARCIHPGDDLRARNLLDPESRWSYTVFLQALGRYLDEKILRGELDGRYSYARESLLHYARWMEANEYLYLHKPEVLEYPTETWSAQDMRKSDVFKFAAKHARGAERARFLERSEYFFDESLRLLGSATTRYFARPRVILMGCGFMQAAFVDPEGHRAPDGPAIAPGDPQSFVPQKIGVMRLAKQLALAGAAALVVLLVLVGVALAR